MSATYEKHPSFLLWHAAALNDKPCFVCNSLLSSPPGGDLNEFCLPSQLLVGLPCGHMKHADCCQRVFRVVDNSVLPLQNAIPCLVCGRDFSMEEAMCIPYDCLADEDDCDPDNSDGNNE